MNRKYKEHVWEFIETRTDWHNYKCVNCGIYRCTETRNSFGTTYYAFHYPIFNGNDVYFAPMSCSDALLENIMK